MPQQLFQRYELIREHARGGMATIYLARDKQTDSLVILKALPRQFTHDPRFRIRFERETQAMSNLKHPAIVPVHDAGEEEFTPYLVLEYMAGGDLSARISQGPIDVDTAVQIITRISQALDFAHKQGIVHRDVKPSNILFDTNGKSYLADFGIVKLAEATQTFTGSAIIGTPAYMSPEQVSGRKMIDGRSDIYSLGIVLFEMLSGQVPYQAETETQRMMKHVLDPVPRIRDIHPEVPQPIEAILMKALAKDPADRYQTAGDFINALATRTVPTLILNRTMNDSEATTEMAPVLTAAPPPPKSRNRSSLVILLLLFLFLLCGGTAAYAMGFLPFLPQPDSLGFAGNDNSGEDQPGIPNDPPATASPTTSPTASPTGLPATITPTSSPTSTSTPTPTFTPTSTPTSTPTRTPTRVPTNTPTRTPTKTPIPPTSTWTPSPTPSKTPTPVPTIRLVSLANVQLSANLPSFAGTPLRGSITFNKDSEIQQTGKIYIHLSIRNEEATQWYNSTPRALYTMQSSERLCSVSNAATNGVNYYFGYQAHCAVSNICSYYISGNVVTATIDDSYLIIAPNGVSCP